MKGRKTLILKDGYENRTSKLITQVDTWQALKTSSSTKFVHGHLIYGLWAYVLSDLEIFGGVQSAFEIFGDNV